MQPKNPSINDIQLYVALRMGLHPIINLQFDEDLARLVRLGKASFLPTTILRLHSEHLMLKYG